MKLELHDKRDVKLCMKICTLSDIFLVCQVKSDVETQGDFVQALATKVRACVYKNIDIGAFVNW